MTHISSHIIIEQALQQRMKGMPEEVREKIEAIREKANEDIEEVLEVLED